MAGTNVGVDKSYYYWRGGLGILLGILILVWPGLTLLTLVTLLSIWLLLAGTVNVLDGVLGVKKGGYGWAGPLIAGIFELGVGAYLVQRPALTTLSIITLIGAVFVVQGFVYLVRTFTRKASTSSHRLLTLIFAALSIAAGIWLWRYPFHGSLAFVWLIGLYTIVSGTMLIAMASEAKD
jgi:uncharacterized membrane protein HdeD (DUF308 family)